MKQPDQTAFRIDKPHARTADDVLQELATSAKGLSADEAAQRLETVGPNRLPAPEKEGLLKRFFKHFNDLLIYILIGAAVVTAMLGHWIDTGVILAVVLINAIIGFIQEGKAEQALEGIRKMLSEVQTLATPLTKQMNRFGKILSVVIVSLAGLLFLIGRVLHEYTTSELFLAAIGFAVAAIPEGLPAILTITLALGVQRMAQCNAITRKLNAIETLGSVTVICSDKTGTLTRNEMTALHVVAPAARYDISGTGYQPEGKVTRDDQDAPLDQHRDLRALIEVLAVCNDSEIKEEDGQWKVTGEPTEGALRTLARKAGFSSEDYERVAAIPFESDNKFMATLDRVPGGGTRILLKGAADRLLDRCRRQGTQEGSTEGLDREFWEQQIEELSNQGLRVLAAAAREVDADTGDLALEDLEQEMVFLGLVSIIDPPRPEAIEAIKSCHEAGIRVKMITGDIGVAMGIKGSEATKEAAEIVLADDNFTSIERAVEEGRTIYDNLRKAILFILPTNGAESLVILVAVLFGLVLPLTPVQILWVNMVTAVTLALALAFEPSEPGLMQRPPRAPGAPILDGAFLWRIGFVSVLIGGATIGVFLVETRLEMPLELARTMAVNTLVFGQIFYLFNSRFLRESSLRARLLFTNRVAWLAVGVLLLLQLGFVYAPFMQLWFGSAPLELRHWLVPLGIGFAVFLLVEAEKAVFRRMTAAKSPPLP